VPALPATTNRLLGADSDVTFGSAAHPTGDFPHTTRRAGLTRAVGRRRWCDDGWHYSLHTVYYGCLNAVPAEPVLCGYHPTSYMPPAGTWAFYVAPTYSAGSLDLVQRRCWTDGPTTLRRTLTFPCDTEPITVLPVLPHRTHATAPSCPAPTHACRLPAACLPYHQQPFRLPNMVCTCPGRYSVC